MPENKEKFIEEITSLTKELISKIGIEGTVNVTEDEERGYSLVVSVVTTDKVDDIIGRNGNGLKSAEHILRVLANKRISEDIHTNFVLDINDYRKTKTNHLIKLAKDIAERVKTSRKAEALNPMSSYERRIVHLELASHSDITTESIGEDPKRRIVIKPL